MQSKINQLLNNRTGVAYKQILENATKKDKPYETFASIWRAYQKLGTRSNNQNGRMFEYAVCETLVQHNVGKMYYQCKLWSMPNDIIDICGWSREGFPVIISCKTSIRERWKQAEMEGRILKGIFPKAASFIVMSDKDEAAKLKERIENREAIGLDRVYVAHKSEFDELIKYLQRILLVKTKAIMPLEGTEF